MIRANHLRVGLRLVLLVASCLAVGTPALGAEVEFLVTWSGERFGNDASATGIITIDDAALLNPGTNDTSVNAFVTDFTMTVSGASSGNGAFTLADFAFIILRTGSDDPGDLPLDFSQELIGQETGTGPWGPFRNGSSGDFNVFAPGAGIPDGVDPFTACTDEGSGDCMELTRFRPVDPGLPFANDLRKCQEALAKAGQVYLGARHKALGKCRNSLAQGKVLYSDKAKTAEIGGAYACASETAAAKKIGKAAIKARKLVEKCTDAQLSQLRACAATVDEVVSSDASTGCLLSSHDAALEDLLDAEFGY